MPPERIALGCQPEARGYVLSLTGNEALAEAWLQQADVVIAGSAPEKWVRKRIRTGKLLLRYSERPLRQGMEPLKYLPRFLKWHWRNPGSRPIYLLCASAYAAADYGRFGLFRGRTYCWGYFPETKKHFLEELLDRKDPASILWCGRFTALKHPESALEAVRRLSEEKLPCKLTFVGTGELEGRLREQTRQLGLEDRIAFLGNQSAQTVRALMETAGIFLFTSDRQEGWGAVLNEAMNSGCAVIASHAIGAVPWLLKSGENGMIYPSGDLDALTEQLRQLLMHPKKQRTMGKKAYETIVTCWNGEEAARRLVGLSEALLAGKQKDFHYDQGPCAPAKELREEDLL